MNKEEMVVNEIKAISRRIGMAEDSEKTVIEVSKGANEDEKSCILKSGSWNDNEPWFVVDEDKKLHTLVSLESLNRLVNTLKSSQEENFNLKLEKTIWKYVPVDFADAWAVAMDEIKILSQKEPNKQAINININNLVKNIKKKHPNLFLNIDDFLPSELKQLG